MALAQIPVKEVHDDPATYRGVPALRMHVGDPIERAHPGDGLAFSEEIATGSGTPGSPTRRLADLYIRRSMSDTRSGDRREPMENILRAYRAWRSKGSLSFVGKQPGFPLTKIK